MYSNVRDRTRLYSDSIPTLSKAQEAALSFHAFTRVKLQRSSSSFGVCEAPFSDPRPRNTSSFRMNRGDSRNSSTHDPRKAPIGFFGEMTASARRVREVWNERV